MDTKERQLQRLRAGRFNVLSKLECLLSEHDVVVQVVDTSNQVERVLYPQLDVFDEYYNRCVAVKMFSDNTFNCMRLEFLKPLKKSDEHWKKLREVVLDTSKDRFLVTAVNEIAAFLRGKKS